MGKKKKFYGIPILSEEAIQIILGKRKPTAKQVYKRIEISAKKRDIDFSLDYYEFAQFWENIKNCYYCNITEKNYIKFIKNIISSKTQGNKQLNCLRRGIQLFNVGYVIPIHFSLDRIDSFDGYIQDNIVKSCWFCNRNKGELIHGKTYKKIAKEIMSKSWKVAKKHSIIK